jgi:hypothetical protein
MAVCKFCSGEMTVVNDCTANRVVRFKKAKAMPAVAYTGEGRCGDCHVMPGFFHHMGCDMERCPKCGGQIISCRCNPT